MIHILIAVATGVAAAVLVILKENAKLKSNEKLHDVELKDAKLEEKQSSLEDEKAKIKQDLNKIEIIKDVPESDIESFWKGRKK
jgi:ribosomal protein L9